MAEMKTLNGFEIVDGKARDDIAEEKAKVEKMQTYITPEMLRADGDTDAMAIQKAFNHAKANRVPIKLDRNYTIDDTVILDSGKNFDTQGLLFDGQGHSIVITVDKPLLKSRGAYNKIHNLTLQYALSFETETGCNYKSTLLTLECDATNSTYQCNGTIIDSVICSSIDMTPKNYVKENVGFEIVCNGTADNKTYAYLLNFTSCSAYCLGTALKITTNEHNLEINGNHFDISSWSCSKYVDGATNGCRFDGLVQAQTLIKKNGVTLNPYLLNNIGNYNVFDCIFYDTAWDDSGIYQKILFCDVSHQNTFTHATAPESFDGAVDACKITFYGDTRHPTRTIPFNPLINVEYINTVANFPGHNSLGVDGITITVEHENMNAYGGFSDKYTDFDASGIPTDFSPLFKDDPWGRGTANLFAKPNATLTFIITAPKPVRMGTVFALCNQWVDGKPSKIEVINENGVSIEGNVVMPSSGKKIYFAEGSGVSTVWKIKFTFNIGAESGHSYEGFSQICGYLWNDVDGII